MIQNVSVIFALEASISGSEKKFSSEVLESSNLENLKIFGAAAFGSPTHMSM